MLGEIFHIEKMMGACEKIIYFLLVNLFFWGSNLPLLLFFVFVGISQAETFLRDSGRTCAVRSVLFHEPDAQRDGSLGLERLLGRV